MHRTLSLTGRGSVAEALAHHRSARNWDQEVRHLVQMGSSSDVGIAGIMDRVSALLHDYRCACERASCVHPQRSVTGCVDAAPERATDIVLNMPLAPDLRTVAAVDVGGVAGGSKVRRPSFVGTQRP
jgi:hypothetical protein